MTIPIFPNCSLHHHRVVEDERGKLVPIEGARDVPFEIARVYYLYEVVPGTERGFHAHRELQQWAVCLAGACTMTVDNGIQRHDVRLDSPDKGLFIGPLIWHEMRDFASGTVLMVLASAPYDEADYIREHDRFLALARGSVR